MSTPLPLEDLDRVLHHVGEGWSRLAGARVLFTGASGFFGSWMLESFLHAGTRLGLPFRAIAVTRNGRRFSEELPHLAIDPRVEILEADAASLPVPDGPVDFIIHSLYAPAPLPEIEIQFEGSISMLQEIASQKQSRGCLLCSTGAVYKAPVQCTPISEEYPRFGAADPLSYPRIRAKAEDHWLAQAAKSGLPATVARGFAFIGPRLPLGGQFAVGNFLWDILRARPITVRGDGLPIRSYLHSADLTVRLWLILTKGRPGGVYNVGGREEITIGETAQMVASLTKPPAGIQILRETTVFSYYVPDTSRLDHEFLLPPPIQFPEALSRTWEWLNGFCVA